MYGYGQVKIKQLDESTALDMASFYLYVDPWISQSRNFINNMVFKGEINVKWGNTFGMKKGSFLSQGELTDLLIRALDWKKLYGMCPYKIVDDEKGKKKVFVPQFGSGSFYQVYNPITLQPVVYFILRNRKYGPISEHMSMERFMNVVKEDGLPVFIWPGLQPNFHTNDYNSEVAKIYREFLKKESFGKDTRDASYNSTHPTLFTQSRIENKSIEEFTETEMYAESRAGFNIPGPEENRFYQRNIFRNNQITGFGANIKKLEFSGDERKMLMDESKHLEIEKPRSFWQNNVYSLPINESIANAPIPKPVVDIMKFEEQYRDYVYTIMGLNRTLMEGQYKRETSSSNELIKFNLRMLIEKHQRDSEMFFQDVYHTMYGLQDKTMILEMIMELKNEELRGIENSISTDKKSKDSEEKKIGIAMLQQMLNRNDIVSLVFEERPLLETENHKDVEFMFVNKYITFTESLELHRRIFGLSDLSPVEIKKLEKERKKSTDLANQQKNKMPPLKSSSQPEKRKGGSTSESEPKKKTKVEEEKKEEKKENENENEKKKKEKENEK